MLSNKIHSLCFDLVCAQLVVLSNLIYLIKNLNFLDFVHNTNSDIVFAYCSYNIYLL